MINPEFHLFLVNQSPAPKGGEKSSEFLGRCGDKRRTCPKIPDLSSLPAGREESGISSEKDT
jgi:hypothetical protein